jgi:catechol 2,3-dioxygenase-like lactoylglutathione lyase family enzyme
MSDVAGILQDRIMGVAHVGFIVPSLEGALADFDRVYGLSPQAVEIQPPAGEDALTRFAFFTIGGLQFELIEPVSAQFKEQLLGMPSGGAGINHLAWRVDDIDAAVALLAARDIYPGHVTPAGVVTIGARKMVYLDPETTGGLVIELIEYPDEPGV